jgi:hypothetical protein
LKLRIVTREEVKTGIHRTLTSSEAAHLQPFLEWLEKHFLCAPQR